MSYVIHPGKMRERVTIQKSQEKRNETGETTLEWVDMRTVWASVEGVSATEFLGAGQQDMEITHKVRMRYFDGLTQKMQFKWRNRILQIISLLEHGNRSQHEAICLEDIE